MQHLSINIKGNIISSEILQKIRDEEIKYQQPADFGLDKKQRVREEISVTWSELRSQWKVFQQKRARLASDDSGLKITRDFWVVPLLAELGYELEPHKMEQIDNRSFRISHRASNKDNLPVYIAGCNEEVNEKNQGFSVSPHADTQEFLNHTNHLYGLVTNGKTLRLLRDTSRIVRLSYLEFDLEKMMEEELYADFALLYRTLHASRMPASQDDGEKSILEFYHQESMASGARIRDKLRDAVQAAMEGLANGFLDHPANDALRRAVRDNKIQPGEFYQALQRTVYRILFLTVIEERNLVYALPEEDKGNRQRLLQLNELYRKYYSMERMRKLALRRLYVDTRKDDLWKGLVATFRLFEPEGYGESLGILPLAGDLFGSRSLEFSGLDIKKLQMANSFLLQIITHLTLMRNEQGELSRVNYIDLDVEELGSVYESLLELHPRFYDNGATITFGFVAGSERKTTGSYYTRKDLVAQLIKSALLPVIEERLAPVKKNRQAAANALLSLKVCDPAAGSGHFLLAAARTIAIELAKVRTGEESPGEKSYRGALREVIQHCIYGVDKNKAAVELCRLALWLEGHNNGKPLSFLEHKIKHGDSLVGVDKLERLTQGIPAGAFKPVTGDDKKVASAQKKANDAFLKKKQQTLFASTNALQHDQHDLAEQYRSLDNISEDDVEHYEQKRKNYESLLNPKWWKDWTACNLFTYAFFQPYDTLKSDALFITSESLAVYLQSGGGTLHSQLKGNLTATAVQNSFFHWPLEFPDVFEQGGFDVMLGNPPWERIKLQEKEFFAAKDPEIAEAANKAAREKLIKSLPMRNPALYNEFYYQLHIAEASSKFIRESDRYPLTGGGDINTYSIFAELYKNSVTKKGRAGFIVPTGIATDDSNKFYFGDLVEQNRLVSLYDFENRKKIFPNVDSRFKFTLLTILGNASKDMQAQFGFFLLDVLDLTDTKRVFALTKQDFLNINPNTKTCPIFRTRTDAELTSKIYSRIPVLIHEEKMQNPWELKFMTMLHMSGDSHLFKTESELVAEGFKLKGNRFISGDDIWMPLYEAKMIWHYDPRYGTYEGSLKENTQALALSQYHNPNHQIKPWYWISKEEVKQRLVKTNSEGETIWQWIHPWLLGFRDITNATNDRTTICTIIPRNAVGHTMPLVFGDLNSISHLILSSVLNSLALDFVARQKVGGTHLTYSYLKQFAVAFVSELQFQLPKCIELTYTSWDIKAFADDVWNEADAEVKAAIAKQWEENKAATGGHEWKLPEWKDAYPEIAWEREAGCPLPPFKWDEDRRAQLKAELDAYYALLYGLTRDELRYILDPQDVYGPDFPGETFRVLKEKEQKRFGEYRTRRLVLEAYDRLAKDWDMEAHLKRLKEVWEQYQVDLTVKEETKPSKPAVAKEPEVPYGQTGLFDEGTLWEKRE